MIVICPKCNKNITPHFTNRSKGLAYCASCRDYFILDDHLKRDVYLIRQEEQFINTIKPATSKTEIKETESGFSVVVADGRLKLVVRIFLVIFLCAIAYATYNILSQSQDHNLQFYLKAGCGILICTVIVLTLILKGPKTILTLNKEEVRINRKRYFLPSYSRIRKTKNLDKINIDIDSDNDGGSSPEIEMAFDNETSLRFGHNLRSKEQSWLLGQLIQIRDTLTLDSKVTEEVATKLSKATSNPVIINTTKPAESNFYLANKSNYISLVIPKDRKTGNTLVILLLYLIGVSIFGTVAIGFWGFLPTFEYHPVFKYVFSIFTLLASYGLFYYLYTFIYRAKHEIFFSPSEIKVVLKPFGLQIEKSRPTKALLDITRSREWNCILLKFKGHKDLRVGFILTKEEIQFLIGALKRLATVVNK